MIDPQLKLTEAARRRLLAAGAIGWRPDAVSAEQVERQNRAAYMRRWRRRNSARNRANDRRAARRWRARHANSTGT